MSANLLAKLKVKNQPKHIDEVVIAFKPPTKKEDVNIKTHIEDRRADTQLDRDQFIENLKEILPITEHSIIAAEEPTIAAEEPTIAAEEPAIDIEEPKKKINTRPKKTGKKLVLVDDLPKKRGRPKKQPEGVARIIPEHLVQIGTVPLQTRLGLKQPNVNIKASSYYLNNREIFINFINSLFSPYKKELEEAAKSATCPGEGTQVGDNFGLMAHQKIVRDYLNLYTPYRGLLIYHGLGAGKTCTSIAIAEGMKDDKKVIVMTPASLRRNYYEQLKECGDTLYRRNQFWEFVRATPENIQTLSTVLNLSIDYINKQGGAWLVNMSKPSNFKTLENNEKSSLDAQLDEMIRYKYQFIAYNGLLRRHMTELTTIPEGKRNPFDNSVVIIDEAHNLVSRIVNKLGRKATDSVSMQLYELLMTAQNARIVLLSGTPIINYPNEIAILFNILRGYIKTWDLKLNINVERRIDTNYFRGMFKSTVLGGNIMDFISYNSSNTTLTITRNPFGFVNKVTKDKYDGVRVGERGEINDKDFIDYVSRLLKKEKINIVSSRAELYKALPDKLDDFKTMFIDEEHEMRNMNLFKKRILGLTSYFRSAQESLMPKYNKSTSDFEIVRIDMSDFQFGVYEEARVQERKLELNNARRRKKGANNDDETVSTYRIFSRAFCNYVFPRPDIKRPMPTKGDEISLENVNEDILDTGRQVDNIDGRNEAEEVGQNIEGIDVSYDEKIRTALKSLEDGKEQYLSYDALATYSPKFLRLLENIDNPDNRGLHLVYSQFRTLEGIGVFKLVLDANGYTEFKIKQVGGNWVLDIAPEDLGKPTYALYTGTESPEQKEIVRKVYNGEWGSIPPSLEAQIRRISGNNLFGEVIKIFMITASGAEGINLKNTRFVHIMEPYWHPVRMEQVIGRARRICSHQSLPEQFRTIKVFLYLMQFSKEQLQNEDNIELRLKDLSKTEPIRPITSDEALYEIARLKEDVTDKILLAVKESAIDCSLHSSSNSSEKLHCYSFGTANPNTFSYSGSYLEEEVDAVAAQNMKTTEVDAVEIILDGVKYALNKFTGEVYDYESYKRGQPVHIGNVQFEPSGAVRLDFI